MLRTSTMLAVTLALFGCGWVMYSMAGVLGSSSFSLRDCDGKTQDETVECVFGVIDTAVRKEGAYAGFSVFTAAYDRYPSFANGGCHARAHRIGDVIYYNLFRGDPDLTKLDFPQEATACGYGFFHGFLEHYIQDRPNADTVTEVCDYMIAHLGDRMRDIESICYHGSGHGFMLAHTERMNESDWGNVAAFSAEPSKRCFELPKANAGDLEQCVEGVYNVVVDYADTQQYGFVYDDKRPFYLCDGVPSHLRLACIYEAAQKLDRASGRDPQKMYSLLAQLKTEDEKRLAFQVGVAGVIMQVIAEDDGGAMQLFDRCVSLPRVYVQECEDAIVWGLYEHGEPQHEYVKALAFCASSEVSGDPELRSRCYQDVIDRLTRFYGPTQIAGICAEFPPEFGESCLNTKTHYAPQAPQEGDSNEGGAAESTGPATPVRSTPQPQKDIENKPRKA